MEETKNLFYISNTFQNFELCMNVWYDFIIKYKDHIIKSILQKPKGISNN